MTKVYLCWIGLHDDKTLCKIYYSKEKAELWYNIIQELYELPYEIFNKLANTPRFRSLGVYSFSQYDPPEVEEFEIE